MEITVRNDLLFWQYSIMTHNGDDVKYYGETNNQTSHKNSIMC